MQKRIPTRRLATIVKQTLIPGSMTFLIAGLTLGVILLNSGTTALQWGRVWLTTLLGIYLLLSLPAVAQLLIRDGQRRSGTVHQPADAEGATILVVLGNGAVHYATSEFVADQLTRRSTFCVFEAARLFRLLRPRWIVTSGGTGTLDERAMPESELMRDLLISFSVPADRILVESASRTTEEQVVNVIQILERRNMIGRFVAVTTSAHMPRVLKLFHDRGVHPIPSVTPELRYDEGRTGWRRWWPSFAALRGSESAIYEYLARVSTLWSG